MGKSVIPFLISIPPSPLLKLTEEKKDTVMFSIKMKIKLGATSNMLEPKRTLFQNVDILPNLNNFHKD
jgi:hypothetical protein